VEAGTPVVKAVRRPQSQPTRLLEEGAPEPELATPGSEELPAGTRVDRYCVISPLGEGGMGVVYEAWDPRLDRRVALKMLRPGRSRGRVLSRDADLLAEAQALARIEHPNIVTVYDFGVTPQGVFITMELCRGQSLRRWLAQSERSVREILDVFIAAGRGLAAAHQAGIVHRDFKPANVLIGEDGSVRVADFGLARPFDLTEDGISASITDSDRESSTIAGTPAYMAPEQLFGRAGDHRMDQFSFCVCLYHALLGHAPFPDRTFDGRRREARAGLGSLERERIERARHVPARVRRAVLRGLEVEPEARFGSMDALLDQLIERKRWPWAMTSLALVLGSGLGAIGMSEARPGPCDRADEVLDGTWGPEREHALAEAIERTGHPDAPARAERVVEQLDAHARAWLDGYTDACRATYVARVQSEPVFDLRMRCLERHRARLDIAVEMMLEVEDPATLDARMPVPFRLLPIDECSDVDALEREAPLVELPLRTHVEELERRIAWANALREGGALQDGLEVARAVVAEARLLEHPAVLARALECLGRLQADGDSARAAEATLREAIEVGARGQDDRLVARAWASLLFTLVLQRELEAGETLGYAAEVAVVRAGDEEARGWLQNNLGILYGEKGDHERAREHLQRALGVKSGLLGEGHLDVGITWINLGSALGNGGRWGEAADAFGRAREIFAATVGQTHPLHDIASTGLCRVAVNSGQHEVALDLCMRALERLEATATSPALESRVRVYEAKALVGLGRMDEALRVAEEARAQVEEDDPVKAGEIREWMEEVRSEGEERERAE
jgi:tetratricopeptide (TPR) repeat protein